MPAFTLEICNKKGLHARAAAKFVKAVAGADVNVVKLGQGGEADSPPVTGSSILGLMMLGADIGSKLHVTSENQSVLAALKELVENKFGEGE